MTLRHPLSADNSLRESFDCSDALLAQDGATLPHLRLPVTPFSLRLGELRLRSLCISMPHRFPRLTRLVNIDRISSRTQLKGKLIELHMNPLALTMCVRTQFLFRRQLEF
jgi:hypothetical protein